MKTVLYIFFICSFSINSFSQDYYVSVKNDTVKCQFKSISLDEIVVVNKNGRERLSTNSVKSFFYKGTIFNTRKLLNDTIKKIEYVFLPMLKIDTVLSEKIEDHMTITTNGITTIYTTSELSMVGTVSYTLVYTFIENDSLGLKRCIIPNNLYSKDGFETIRALHEFFYDRPDLQDRLQKPKQYAPHGNKKINSILQEYFGKEVFR